MDEIYGNIRNDPFLFYFALIFALLWGGGVIWGVVFVLRSLGKKRLSVKAFRKMGFLEAKNNPLSIRKAKELCARTVASEFFSHIKPEIVDMVAEITAGRDTISIIDHDSGTELLLYNILCREKEQGVDLYAGCIEKESGISALQPVKNSRSASGWIVCLSGNTSQDSTTVVRRRFSGYRKLMIKAALKMAGAEFPDREPAQNDFDENFQTVSRDIENSGPVFDEYTERLIAKNKDHFPEGVKLYIGKHGIWMRAEEWYGASVMEYLYRMCEDLLVHMCQPDIRES